VFEQYERTVRPSAEWFVYPTEKYADLVVSGVEPFERSTSAVIAEISGTDDRLASSVNTPTSAA